MHYLTIPARNRVLRLCGRPPEPDFLCKQERELRCIFFHIPKTGGLAICESLFGGFHVNHRLYVKCERQDPASLVRYWKFCIMRDPVSRFLSAYRFLKAGGLTGMDRQFRAAHAEAFHDLKTFVAAFRNQESIQRYVHFRPQTDFICNSAGEVKMDYIGRFEAFQKAFDFISRRVGVSTDLERVNAGPYHEKFFSLDSDDEVFIKSFYLKDIEIILRLFS